MDHTKFIQIAAPETGSVYALDADGKVWVYTTRQEKITSDSIITNDLLTTRYGWAELAPERFPPKEPPRDNIAQDLGELPSNVS